MQEEKTLGKHEGKELLHYLDPRADPRHAEFDEDSYHNCPGCQKPTINARIRALNGDRRCIECSATVEYKGCMDYSHKTAPVLMVTKDPEQFRQIRKLITHQR